MSKSNTNIFDMLIILLVFISSRYFLSSIGINFDISLLETRWQLADTYFLKHDLFKTLLYSHSQPPLYNLITGIGLKLFSSSFQEVMGLFYRAFNLAFIFLLYTTLKTLRVNRVIIVVSLCFYILTPAVILIENWFSYEQLVVTFLASGVFFSSLFFRDGKNSDMFLALCSYMFCSLTVASFHLVWLIFIWLVFIAFKLKTEKKVKKFFLIVSALPVLVILSLHIKNYYIFNVFDLSPAHVSQNLVVLGIKRCPKDIVSDSLRKKNISDSYRRTPFKKIDSYVLENKDKFKDIEVLIKKRKTAGAINTNYLGYLEKSYDLRKDFLSFIKIYPDCFIRNVGGNLLDYFKPPGAHVIEKSPVLRGKPTPNFLILKEYTNLFNKYILLQDSKSKRSYLLLIILPTLILLSVFLILFSGIFTNQEFYLLVILLFTILFVVFSMLISYGDHERYRFRVDPYFLILGVLFLDRIYHSISKS